MTCPVCRCQHEGGFRKIEDEEYLNLSASELQSIAADRNRLERMHAGLMTLLPLMEKRA